MHCGIVLFTFLSVLGWKGVVCKKLWTTSEQHAVWWTSNSNMQTYAKIPGMHVFWHFIVVVISHTRDRANAWQHIELLINEYFLFLGYASHCQFGFEIIKFCWLFCPVNFCKWNRMFFMISPPPAILSLLDLASVEPKVSCKAQWWLGN